MALRNSIIFERNGKIKFDTNGKITLPATMIKNVQKYACPLRLVNVEQYTFENGIFKVELPGRYIAEYE